MAATIKKFLGLDDSLDRALPRGSLILVTGASGYIASHIVNEALLAGYKVRGTARTEDKAAATVKLFKNSPDYSTAVVADFQHEGVFDEAVQGVDSVIHVASDTSFGYDPNVVVKGVVAGTLSILRSAVKSPSVKRFVLTSSSAAVGMPSYDKPQTWGADTWNQFAVDQAWTPPFSQDRAFIVYAASKTEGERALWQFVKEEKPHFVVNAILPNFNAGRVLASRGPTGGTFIDALQGSIPEIFGSQYIIDVIDDARLHLIAAAVDSNLANERIYAFNTIWTWTEVVKTLHKLRPNAKNIATPPPNEKPDLTRVDNKLGADLLRKWYGQQEGYKTLEQTIAENIEGIEG